MDSNNTKQLAEMLANVTKKAPCGLFSIVEDANGIKVHFQAKVGGQIREEFVKTEAPIASYDNAKKLLLDIVLPGDLVKMDNGVYVIQQPANGKN